ncbi:DUF3800 domain-containing protein [Fructilactobacillus fructivorans]|uniref:DUF3800 domain-containing protein n=1 Tax=Fructilactobacillus fructivorans TaxID=1614 RepID=UPI001781924F|nr:DUF3800 domain-containing protein [Fructilactobacillus fructivorans]
MYIDESGNLGAQGRYFTIAGICCENRQQSKKLKNKIKKCSRKAKGKFNNCYTNNGEVKSAECNIIIKDYYYRSISNIISSIYYVVVDLEQVYGNLRDHQNILYNYLLSFLVRDILKDYDNLSNLKIHLDNRTIKVGHEKTFGEYIKQKVWGDFNRPFVNINVEYVDSQRNYKIQAADFVVNNINSHYLYGKNIDSNLTKVIKKKCKFPYKTFGK